MSNLHEMFSYTETSYIDHERSFRHDLTGGYFAAINLIALIAAKYPPVDTRETYLSVSFTTNWNLNYLVRTWV